MCMNTKEILWSWEASNTHFPLLSNLSRISLTGFLTIKTRKGRSLAGASCGGSIGIRRAVWVVMIHSVLNRHLLVGWNTMQISMHDKLMGLLGQCWLSTLIFLLLLFFLSVSRRISFSKKQSDQDYWRTDSHTSLGKAGQISLKKSQVLKPPHHLSSPTEGWQSYQALNKTECEIRRANVLHTSHVKTNLYIQTL